VSRKGKLGFVAANRNRFREKLPAYIRFIASEGLRMFVCRGLADRISKKHGYYLDFEIAQILRMFKSYELSTKCPGS
jgi:hypothetical protein